ncbi:MAG: DegV family EDD domain-containing protein [Ruminococcus sp.]|nr:DegV family EDD domain-containing protein [Ruminococcus sp.]
MMLKKIKKYIFNEERDIHGRLFVLIMFVLLSSWIITLAELLIMRSSLQDIVFIASGIVLAASITMLSVKIDKLGIGAAAISLLFSLVFLPGTFFLGGGLDGDAPLWFLFCVLFISITLHSKIKIAYLILISVEAIFCWYMSYHHPSVIVRNSNSEKHIFSLTAMLLIGISISIMIAFRNMLYNRQESRLQSQKKEIEMLSEAQNRFFSSMSHEIRTPINTITALNEMILREDISDEVAEDAVNIRSASKMLLHLINDILDMSKFASGQMKLTTSVYNPGDMLSEIVGMLWIRAKEKNLDFTVKIAPDIPVELIGDEMRIKQILINVLNNAIKYTREGSVSLSIDCGTSENGMMNVIYTVRDTGIGIKKENIPHLFDAFKRVDEEKNRHIEGTGLGLSIVKQFVDLMGGRITVNSIYTKGSTFVIEIPQKISDMSEIGEISIDSLRRRNTSGANVSKFEAPDAKVLVVDDNTSNLLVAAKLLRDTKVKVDTVSSGEEALRKTLNEYYHVIFMDHLMPQMDGIECLHAIRSQTGGRCKNSKIVSLTANVGSENRLMYEREGFDGYLPKPVTGDEICRELYRLLPKEITVVMGSEEEILRETISWMNTGQRKKNVVITTESVADLPQEIIEKYNVAVLPHLVCTSEGSFMDGVEIETRGLLEYMKTHQGKVETRVPDVQTIETFFAKQLLTATNIIHVSISSQLANSGCPVAQEAAKAFDNVTVIDSGQLSSGQGLLVIEACRLAESGKTPEEIAEQLESIKTKIHSSFVVEDLDFLARSDQISEKLVGMTKAFMLKPVLKLKKGKMRVGKVYFGTRERTWRKYIRWVLRDPEGIDRRMLFVTCVGLSRSETEWIREEIKKHADFGQIYLQKASPVIAVNCGNGTFGILTMDAEHR